MWKIKPSNKQKHIKKRLCYFDYFFFQKHMNNTSNQRFPRPAILKSVCIFIHMGKSHRKIAVCLVLTSSEFTFPLIISDILLSNG